MKYLQSEACKLLSISRGTLLKLEKEGKIQTKRMYNGYRYYTEEDIIKIGKMLYGDEYTIPVTK